MGAEPEKPVGSPTELVADEKRTDGADIIDVLAKMEPKERNEIIRWAEKKVRERQKSEKAAQREKEIEESLALKVADVLGKLLPCVSKESLLNSKHELSSFLFNVEKRPQIHVLTIFASDDRVAGMAELKLPIIPDLKTGEFLLPWKEAQKLRGLAKKSKVLYPKMKDENLTFVTHNEKAEEISFETHKGSYPDWKSVIPENPTNVVTINIEWLEKALSQTVAEGIQRVKIESDPANHKVYLKFAILQLEEAPKEECHPIGETDEKSEPFRRIFWISNLERIIRLAGPNKKTREEDFSLWQTTNVMPVAVRFPGIKRVIYYCT